MSSQIAGVPRLQTIGISPKAWASSIAGYVAPLVVGVIAEKLGVDIEVPTVAALLLPLITAALTFAVAKAAKPGLVVNLDEIDANAEKDIEALKAAGEAGQLPVIPGAKDGEEQVQDSETFER